ncbi:hypothetical protein [Paenibacillus dokdonensis]|uniref:hypothetical protein n=1 Tax=Paenibacillus dokdonensis TaxID=2567944 RepID=UPI0010A8AACA|nr:hypothetical protein [Paenibacillus dokdonensis]
MEKEVWKWLFSDFPDKSLILLICGVNETVNNSRMKIAIKGVSDLSKIKAEQINLFRNRIEVELNKPKNISKVKFFLRKYAEHNKKKYKELEEISQKETDVMLEEIQASDSLNVHDLIIHLMIQTDSLLIKKGVEVFGFVQDSNSAVKEAYTNGETKIEKKEDVLEDSNPIQEKRYESQIEIERLMAENQKFKSEINKLIEDKKEAIKESKELKKIIIKTESEKNEANKNLQKLERELHTRKWEIGTRDRKNQELQDMLAKLEEAKIELRNENSNLTQRVLHLEEEINAIEIKRLKEKDNLSIPRRIVTIIDRNMPDGLDGLENFEFHLINPNQLEEVIRTDKLNKSDEIWYIKFRLPGTKQSLLNDKYGNKVTGFKTIIELKDYCNIIY